MIVYNSREALGGASRISQSLHRILICAAAGFAVAAVTSRPGLAQEQNRHDVLELFTSQGCSSCPPADALLQKLAARKDIIALSFPVSYWDHLGWRDTLAKDAFNQRQYDYAEARGDREVYTPQLIVNGITHVIGSRKTAIETALSETARKLASSTVPISVEISKGAVELDAGAAPDGSSYRSGKLWIACYSHSVDVLIGRGENNGRDIVYTNVVRDLVSAGQWAGSAAHYSVKLPDNSKYDGVAVFLQADRSFAMLGATAMTLPSQ